MKLLNKKEEKRSVGRPKLADDNLKKKSFIMLGVSLAVVLTILFTGAYNLNIINFLQNLLQLIFYLSLVFQ